MLKFEWKTKFFPNFFLTKKAGIIFQQYEAVLYNLFIQEHCKLINLFEIWTLLRPPFSWVLDRVECLILGCFRFQTKSFWILFTWSMITCGTLVTKARWITFEIAKVLKILILLWIIVLYTLRTFSIFFINSIKFSSFSIFLL